MKRNVLLPIVAGFLVLIPCGTLPLRAQDADPIANPTPEPDAAPLAVEHAECAFFGPKREQFVKDALSSAGGGLSDATQQVEALLTFAPPGGSRTQSFQQTHQSGSIDSYIYSDLQANNIQPADRTTDYEFIRRVTLDLTGRIPTPERVLAFAADTSSNKRAKLIDELLAKSEWVDKWTMYFGDRYKNNARNTQMNRYPEGRNAFYKWIRDSLAANKPYDKMATELIAAQGGNTFDQTQGNDGWLVGGFVTGGPQQDIFDQQAADVADTFLGITHMNCILCHNGRGHLDALSLWGKTTTRYDGWQFASFLSRTNVRRVVITDPAYPTANNKYYYWALDSAVNKADYALNTTTGNRPARQPVGAEKTIAPVYPFNGSAPAKGEDYRVALARFVTSDIQFARATVNYMWKEFFGRGIVDPPDQFDLARLDPDNPPPDPWTLQPSNARLLNALALRFVDNGYDLKALMREIANSETYQLSSRYNGQWDVQYEKYFARKFVRRLWGEEIHDAVVQATGVIPSYTVPNFSNPSERYGVESPGFGKISFAMQAPDVMGMPDGGAVSAFVDAFFRGNRDDELRRPDGSILQVLNLMNDGFIQNRIHASTAGSLLARNLSLPDDQLVNTMFLAALSRPPSADEKSTALAKLKNGSRTASAEDLLWTLFNKVDFVFNY